MKKAALTSLFFFIFLKAPVAQLKQLPEYKVPLTEKIFGNSWSISASNTWAHSNSCELSIARTFHVETHSGGPAGGPVLFSWGASLAYVYSSSTSPQNPFIGAFMEETATDFILGINARLEYMQSASGQYRFITPAIGYSFGGHIDLCYNFNVAVGKGGNIYNNGVNLRVRFFTNKKKWVYKKLG